MNSQTTGQVTPEELDYRDTEEDQVDQKPKSRWANVEASARGDGLD